MVDKKLKRRRRATKGRAKIRELRVIRLCVGRTVKHLYAQLITSAEKGDKVLASASTLDKEVRTRLTEKSLQEGKTSVVSALNNVKSAAIVGGVIAERALALGVSRVAFDRSGFKYHGRVKALAEAARGAGLLF
jgi:large subunit ribosomal protein L18